jgi:hypothetical protein
MNSGLVKCNQIRIPPPTNHLHSNQLHISKATFRLENIVVKNTDDEISAEFATKDPDTWQVSLEIEYL